LVLASLIAGCQSPPPSTDNWCDGTCVRHRCFTVLELGPNELPSEVSGADVEILAFGSPCRVQARWLPPKTPGLGFHATIAAHEGDLLPFRDGLVQLRYCKGIVHPAGGNARRPGSDFILDPDPSPTVPALAPGHVFIPFQGEAALDRRSYARARVDGPRDAGDTAPSVTILLGDRDDRSETSGAYPALHVGEAFRWGGYRATIVHIVHPSASTKAGGGWVEVGLVEAAPDGG
jgi:hypothetical protein